MIGQNIRKRTARDHRGAHSGATSLACALLLLAAASAGLAQDATIGTLMAANDASALTAAEGSLFVGTSAGGVVVFDRETLAERDRWVSGPGLTGNQVSDLCWTGRFLWVATLDNGLTRVADPGSDSPGFRQYLANLGSREVSCVTGAILEQSEVVYYAMVGGGVGKISDGIPGLLYTAEQNGLLSNDINALQMLGSDLFIATDVGVSRLRGELATTQNDGLPNLIVNDFCLDGDGNLICGTNNAVYQWDPDAESWFTRGGIGSWVKKVAWQEGGPIWALGLNSSGNGVLAYDTDGPFQTIAAPYLKTTQLYADADVFVGGRALADGMAGGSGHAFVSRHLDAGGFATGVSDLCLVRNPEGMTFQAEGTVWVGSWLADAISSWDEQRGWRHIYEVADADNDYNGLINQGANVLCMAEDAAGHVWAGQFGSGVLRIDPADMSTDQLTTSNSGLDGALVLNLIAHPDGPLMFLHDMDGGMVDVLLDTDDWEAAGSWMSLPEAANTIGTDGKVWEALVERRDIVWFAVEGRGLLRWDINGDYAGENDELTWSDTGDDSWSDPITAFVDTNGTEVSDPSQVRGLALAADGTIWAAGSDLVRFSWDDFNNVATALEFWDTKTASYETGLVGGDLVDVVVDVNDDVWITGKTGLNRLRWRDGTPEFDVYLDLTNYLLYPNNRLFYSTGVISELPGQEYRAMKIDASGTRLVVAADQGSALITVEEGYDTVEVTSLGGLYVYPNPFKPGETSDRLGIGGLTDAADGEEAEVEIYNLEGQLVYRDRSVEPGTGFWSGRNRPGEDVTTGLYVVRITWRGETVTRTLAVVR